MGRVWWMEILSSEKVLLVRLNDNWMDVGLQDSDSKSFFDLKYI